MGGGEKAKSDLADFKHDRQELRLKLTRVSRSISITERVADRRAPKPDAFG
jgi:hypothetical protein